MAFEPPWRGRSRRSGPPEPPEPPESPEPAWRLQTLLRRQLLALLSGLWLLGCLASGLALWHETDEVLDSALTETAQRLLMLPGSVMGATWPASGVGPAAPQVLAMGAHEEFVVYQVFDGRGQMLSRSHQAPDTPLDAGAPDGLRQAGAWQVRTLTAADGQRRAQVAETVAHRREVLWASVSWLLVMLVVMWPLAGLGVGWVLRRGFATLEPARQDLARRSPDDLAPVALSGAPAELRPWLASVNLLLARVATLVDNERALAANLAHELRTPLAAARAQAQRLAQTGQDPAVQGPARALVRQLDRLALRATRLLQLARVESGVALQREPVDLVQLAVLVADDFAEAQRAGRLHLQVHGQPAPVLGDIDALGMALRNLIDNALKHGGDAATVTVHVQGASVRVDDDGPGAAEALLPTLARRFTRGRPLEPGAGSGLGLWLVQTIADRSGVRLHLASPGPSGRGFSASLCFGDPARPAAELSPE